MNQLALDLPGMPLTADEQLLLKRLGNWCHSGIGGMTFSTIMYQLGWSQKKAGPVVTSLEQRGLIWHCSWIGEYFIEKVFPKAVHGNRSEEFSALLSKDYEDNATEPAA